MLKIIFATFVLAFPVVARAQTAPENLGFNYGFVSVAARDCGGSVAGTFKQAVSYGVSVFGKEAIQRGIDEGVKMASAEDKVKLCAAAVMAYGPKGLMVTDAYLLPKKRSK